MADYSLDRFLKQCREVVACNDVPAGIVTALAPAMLCLLGVADDFLESSHYRASPEHYARNLIFAAEDDSLSLFALVWEPGQWTPVHDHGS